MDTSKRYQVFFTEVLKWMKSCVNFLRYIYDLI